MNNDKTDKTDDFRVEKFKKTNDCKKSRDFMNDDGSDNTDDFKKTLEGLMILTRITILRGMRIVGALMVLG